MNKLKAITLMMAVFFGPAALADGNHVLGEKLDSGLGELAPGYTAQEFMPASLGGKHVLGEKLDSGLGELAAGYTARELMPASPAGKRVLGEKLDSGLGELTREDIGRVLTASHRNPGE